jgi:hypothetical protein
MGRGNSSDDFKCAGRSAETDVCLFTVQLTLIAERRRWKADRNYNIAFATIVFASQF